MNWFRWYTGTATDPKFLVVARLSGQNVASVVAVWAMLLERASDGVTQCDASVTQCDARREESRIDNITPDIPNGISAPSGGTPTARRKTSNAIFKPPTVEEVEAYCRERGNAVDAGKWWDFYASKGWLVGKAKMKDWKAAVRTWEREAGLKAEQEKPWTIPEWMQKGREVRQ